MHGLLWMQDDFVWITFNFRCISTLCSFVQISGFLHHLKAFREAVGFAESNLARDFKSGKLRSQLSPHCGKPLQGKHNFDLFMSLKFNFEGNIEKTAKAKVNVLLQPLNVSNLKSCVPNVVYLLWWKLLHRIILFLNTF